jgi:protein-tyrosine phosphatase
MPRPRGGEWLDDEMAALRALGVTALVCLLTQSEQDELELSGEADAAASAGLAFWHVPVVDLGVPDPDQLTPVVDDLVGVLATGGDVVVHCRAGIGRASLLAAAILVRLNVPAAVAWDAIATARGMPVPETNEQRDWLDRHCLPAPVEPQR